MGTWKGSIPYPSLLLIAPLSLTKNHAQSSLEAEFAGTLWHLLLQSPLVLARPCVDLALLYTIVMVHLMCQFY